MKTIRDYMKNEGKTIYIIFAILLFITLSANIYNSVKSYKYRRFCDEYRTELNRATETNRELTARIGRIAEITGRITETADANIADARDIIETVEILRAQIQELEDCCNDIDSVGSYYNYWDNEFRNKGLMD